MSKFIDLTGQKFGLLTVTKRAENSKHGTARFFCKCDCGFGTLVLARNLKTGFTKSCGCLHRKIAKDVNTTHGQTKTIEYQTWARMKARCLNKKTPSYKDYGGRGISICNQWLNSFEIFFSDMGFRPSDNHSLDRINNGGNYEPDNCRWATKSEQSLNRRPLVQTKLRSKNTTGIIGVTLYNDKYRARIVYKGIEYHLGYFDTLQDATYAREQAKNKLFSGSDDMSSIVKSHDR